MPVEERVIGNHPGREVENGGRVVPLLGRLTPDSEAYNYLPESVRSFPSPERLARRMDGAGLSEIHWTILAGGIIAIHGAVAG